MTEEGFEMMVNYAALAAKRLLSEYGVAMTIEEQSSLNDLLTEICRPKTTRTIPKRTGPHRGRSYFAKHNEGTP